MHFSPQSGAGTAGGVPGTLRSLRLSLNAPVVSIAELAVGPASAAIAVHEAPDGACSLTVAIRCQRTNEVALFGPGVEVGASGFTLHAIEAAISFAEGMGFLFDDDLFADPVSGASTAAQAWAGFVVGEPGVGIEEILTKFRRVASTLAAGAG
jgi:hypothetical protein